MSSSHSKLQHLGGGDASNSEMGTAFAGTIPSEAVALLAMVPDRHS